MGARRWMWPAVVGALVVVLLAVSLFAVDQRRDARALRRQVEGLAGRSTTTTMPVERAEDRPSEGGGDEAAEDPFGGLFGDDDGEGTASLLDPEIVERCMPALTSALRRGDESSSLAGLLTQQADPEVSQIAEDVEDLRELDFQRQPAVTVLTQEEAGRRVAEEFAAEFPDDVAAAETRTLIALGALPPGSNLEQLMASAIDSQVAGFYDPETGELVITDEGGESMSALAQVTLAHELDHALTDQGLGLPNLESLDGPGEEDASLAQLSLVEGDATLLMQMYATTSLSLLAQLGSSLEAGPAQEALERLPHHVQRTLLFPYLDGLGFVCSLYADGGWEAVNRAYDLVPTSSDQILFPERYLAGERPLDPTDPGSPGAGWSPGRPQSFGAAQLLWLLEAPGGDVDRAVPDARQRVEAWGGGELMSWYRGAETAVGISMLQRPGESGLCGTVRAWVGAANLPAVVNCEGQQVRVGIAADEAVATVLAG